MGLARNGYGARGRLGSRMKGPLKRRVLGTLLSGALGFILGLVLTAGIGEPIWWLIAGILGAAFCGGYAALFGTPWMHESSRRAIQRPGAFDGQREGKGRDREPLP